MREKYRRQMNFSEDIQVRQTIVKDILKNWKQYPQFRYHLTYDIIIKMRIDQLYKIVEQLKSQIVMD